MQYFSTVVIVSTFITATAMIVVAIYSRLTYLLSRKQDARYSNPDIKVYGYNRKYYPGEEANRYSILIVNSGEVPMVVTQIIEMTTEGKQLSKITDWWYPPRLDMGTPGVYMDTLPWAIQKGGFGICSRHLKEIPDKTVTPKLKIRIEYQAGNERQKAKETLVVIQPR